MRWRTTGLKRLVVVAVTVCPILIPTLNSNPTLTPTPMPISNPLRTLFLPSPPFILTRTLTHRLICKDTRRGTIQVTCILRKRFGTRLLSRFGR
ncbi:hypothetical protein I307_06530 [Cryptococcus deuterogattii 99/473]|uniref:Uncharacterized protein n=1 Tax=Cryptococcus deuterogattii Ram5 TaxID=1296110 RepID=A0A0D0V063_9TREE|nr:hypothetical protein I313_03522 [Cryptococcus deuterogattii Ram5]KIY54139.1 hypothetical protein I307_06530 [Cryptococcus deuterogattii 99/473]